MGETREPAANRKRANLRREPQVLEIIFPGVAQMPSG